MCVIIAVAVVMSVGRAVWPGGINELKVSTEGLILERMGSDKG